MFTIKHTDNRFNDFAVEVASYSTSVDAEGVFRLLGFETPYNDGNYIALFAGRPSDHRGPDTDSIYVMNRHGSTVAKYHFLVDRSNQACANHAALAA